MVCVGSDEPPKGQNAIIISFCKEIIYFNGMCLLFHILHVVISRDNYVICGLL